ncbi:MAG: MFS transporter [Tepidiformaceae bacterium]
MPEQPPTRPAFFHGWVIVGASFGVLFVAFGTAYSFAAFFHSLRDEFNATRGDISLVFALTGFLYFGLGAVSGPIADKFGPRRVILSGILLVAVGLLLASAAQALWQVYLTYSLCVGVGVGLAYVPAVGAVQRWFSRRRGFASGLAVAGIGAGTLAMPLIAAFVIDAANWRLAYGVLAALTLLIGVPSALLMEHSPGRRGLGVDGDAVAAGTNATTPLAGFSLRAAFRQRPFWLLYAAGFSTSLGIFVPFAHLAPYARDHGFSDGFGALLVGLIGVGSTVGRLGLGGSADRIGRRVALIGAFAGMGVALFGWLGATEAWSLCIFALVFGAAYGGFVALVPALATDYFGGRNAGGIIGWLYTGAAFGALLGPTLAGAVYDARDSYTLPILLGVAMNGVAVACVLALPEPAHWLRGRTTS